MKVTTPAQLIEFFGDLETAANAIGARPDLVEYFIRSTPNGFAGNWQEVVDAAVDNEVNRRKREEIGLSSTVSLKRPASFYVTDHNRKILTDLGMGNRSKGMRELIKKVFESGTLGELLCHQKKL